MMACIRRRTTNRHRAEIPDGMELRIPASDLWKPLTLLFQMEIVICSSNRHLWWGTLTILRGSPSLGYNFHQLSQLPLKVKVLATQSCSTLWDSMDYSPPGSPIQARILEVVGISFSRGSSQLRDWTQVSYTAGRFFTIWAKTLNLPSYNFH